MAKRNRIAYVLLLMLIFSCEKQRFLNVPFTDSEVVLNGLFSPGQPCMVELSRSQFLNDTNAVQGITTATVSLFEGQQFLEQLTYSSPSASENLGSYSSEFTAFKRGQRYSVQVELNEGAEVISAADAVPSDTAYLANVQGPAILDRSEEFLHFNFDIVQLGLDSQYYHLFLQNRWGIYSSTPRDSNLNFTHWFEKDIIPEGTNTGFITSGSEPFKLNVGRGLRGIMLDNQTFTNGVKSIQLSAKSLPQNKPNLFLESRIILRKVSANYFKYYFSSSQLERTKGVPLTEPVIIHDNVVNGIGNFSAYLTSDTSAVVRTYYPD